MLCERRLKETRRRSSISQLQRLFGIPSVALAICCSATAHGLPRAKTSCHRAILEGEAPAGKGFDRVFASGLRLFIEPLSSGWIVRVLDADAPREAHDYAEVATPPYQSVSPLLISTDWAFRAQDAVGWNPRHFRFASSRASFQELKRLQAGALQGDGNDSASLAELVVRQPEGTLEILDARFAPGTADQGKMAAAVALHLQTTPHDPDMTTPPTKLGRLEHIKFRVELDLPPNVPASPGTKDKVVVCDVNQPARSRGHHSH